MAANCNVIPLVWDWIAQKSLGLVIGNLSLQPFIDQFNTVSGCKVVVACEEPEEKDCEKDFIYLCNFIIGPINTGTSPEGLTLVGAPIELYLGGTTPYNIVWTWDSAVFHAVGGQGTSVIQLQRNSGVPSPVVTTVSVRAHDGAGCKDEGAITFTLPAAVVDCGSAVLNPVDSYIGLPYSGTLTIPYTGGNGEAYTALTILSTGVTGLTAVLPAGTLATGSGNLVFNVTGIPAGTGTGQFSFKLFSDTACVIAFSTADTVCEPTLMDHVYHPFDVANNWYPVEITWIPKTNAVSYSVTVTHGAGPADPPIVVAAPASSTFINVPPLETFSVSLVVNCLFSSTAVSFSDTAPAAPAVCPQPTNFSASIVGYDPIQKKFAIQLRWDIMLGSMGYIVRDVNAGTSSVTGSRIITVYKDANVAYQFGVKTDCGNLSGESTEALANVTTPVTPVSDPSPWPVLHYMDNVSTQLVNAWYMQTWITVDGNSDWVRIFQKNPFDSAFVDALQYPADSKELFLGTDNGYLPLPPGFGSNDIFFGDSVAPKGRTLNGNALNFVRIAVIRGTSVPQQGSATYFDYWMNVPEQYTIRMSGEDYITTDPAIGRPTLSVTYPGPGSATVIINPFPFNYDACSKYNIFLVSETGTIYTRSQSGNPTNQAFTGMAPGRYLAFAEITRDACVVFSGNVETALPIFVTIT